MTKLTKYYFHNQIYMQVKNFKVNILLIEPLNYRKKFGYKGNIGRNVIFGLKKLQVTISIED